MKLQFHLHQHQLSKELNKREKYLFGGGILLISFFLFKSYIFYYYNEYKNMGQKIEVLSREKSALSNQNPNSVQAIQARLNWIGEKSLLEGAEKNIFSPAFLDKISIQKNQISPLKEENGLLKREVNLLLSGNFIAIRDYLNTLQNQALPLVIETLSITPKGVDGSVYTQLKGAFYALIP